jgi:hypothetical protein
MRAHIYAPDEFNALFDAAPREQLADLLRKRGIFTHPEVPKEELRPLFAMGFSFEEYLQLKGTT